jgi:two-component system chemotaxis sensor kinase CheA
VIAKAECFAVECGKVEASAVESDSEEAAAPIEEHEQLNATNPVASENFAGRRTPLGETVLRVDAEKIDNVLNLVGELIIGKSMLQQVMTEYALRSPKDSLRARVGDAMGFQARVLTDLQHSVIRSEVRRCSSFFDAFLALCGMRRCGATSRWNWCLADKTQIWTRASWMQSLSR